MKLSSKNKLLRIGISSCLLGEKVRFDANHKKNDFLIALFSSYVEWVPVCPEVEVGLGVPRDTLHLEEVEGETRLIQSKNKQDLTQKMDRFAHKKIAVLRSQKLSGYILKKNSPTCGLQRVKLYGLGKKVPQAKGQGVFAAALQKAFPHLPMEEEGRLLDPQIRDNFIERIFAYQKLQVLLHSSRKISDLIHFHAQHKLSLMAHHPELYRVLGKTVAEAKKMPYKALLERYQEVFMQALSRPVTRARHVNVLLHVLGFFKKRLDLDSRQELLAYIEDYRMGKVSIVGPLVLIRYFAKKFQLDYLLEQTYLHPISAELVLRNYI